MMPLFSAHTGASPMQYTSEYIAPATIEIATPEMLAQANTRMRYMLSLLDEAYNIIHSNNPNTYNQWLSDVRLLLDEMGE
jgi:hypothetical protein